MPVQNSIVQANTASTDVVAARSLSNLKVNAGGRLLEVSREASLSVILLRRELVAQLNVASASSVQVSDLAGKQISSDEDLKVALQEGKHPLQAKLTVSALHEIEQKKREAEVKKEELLNYQWQVLCEQIHTTSQEVGTLASQLAGVKEECVRAVRSFQENEELRRQEMGAQIAREVANREELEKSLMARVEAVAKHTADERLARDVGINQVVLRIEQVESIFNSDRSLRAREQEAFDRTIASLKHEFDMDAQRRAEDWSQNLELAKRIEGRLAEQSVTEMEHHRRLLTAEADVEKMKSSLNMLETNVALHHRAAHDGLQRSGEELRRAMMSGTMNSSSKTDGLFKTFEINQQSLEARVQGLREEALEDRAALENRAQGAENRVMTLEKELRDYQNAQALKEQLILDRLSAAVTVLDSLEMSQKANDVVVTTTSTQVQDLVSQYHNIQGAVHERIRSDAARSQFDTLNSMLSNCQLKTSQLEQELSTRLAQEAAHRDGLRVQIHESVRKAFDKLTLKFEGSSANNLRRSMSVTSVKSATSEVATDDWKDSPRRIVTGSMKEAEIGGETEEEAPTVLTADTLPRRAATTASAARGRVSDRAGGPRVIAVRPTSASSVRSAQTNASSFRRVSKPVEPVAGPTVVRRIG